LIFDDGGREEGEEEANGRLHFNFRFLWFDQQQSMQSSSRIWTLLLQERGNMRKMAISDMTNVRYILWCRRDITIAWWSEEASWQELGPTPEPLTVPLPSLSLGGREWIWAPWL
jgi:hypothetical protein